MSSFINTFPNEKLYTLPNCKSWQTTILNLKKMVEISLKRIENSLGKGEIACYEQFLLFPLCFEDCRRLKTGLIGKWLTQSSPSFFTCLQYKSFENTEDTGEIAFDKKFFLFPQCFLPVWIIFCNFQFGKGLTLSQTSPGFYLSAVQVF